MTSALYVLKPDGWLYLKFIMYIAAQVYAHTHTHTHTCVSAHTDYTNIKSNYYPVIRITALYIHLLYR